MAPPHIGTCKKTKLLKEAAKTASERDARTHAHAHTRAFLKDVQETFKHSFSKQCVINTDTFSMTGSHFSKNVSSSCHVRLTWVKLVSHVIPFGLYFMVLHILRTSSLTVSDTSSMFGHIYNANNEISAVYI